MTHCPRKTVSHRRETPVIKQDTWPETAMRDRSAGQDAESRPVLSFPGEGLGQTSRAAPASPHAEARGRRSRSPEGKPVLSPGCPAAPGGSRGGHCVLAHSRRPRGKGCDRTGRSGGSAHRSPGHPVLADLRARVPSPTPASPTVLGLTLQPGLTQGAPEATAASLV